MAGYRYGGTEFDAHLPITEPLPEPVPRSRPTCGTRSGYNSHRVNKEPACDECKAANNAYTADWARRKKARQISKGWTKEKCGTVAGYSAHRRHAVPICDACREASTEYNRARR